MRLSIRKPFDVTIPLPARSSKAARVVRRTVTPASLCPAAGRGGIVVVHHPDGEVELSYSRFNALVGNATITVLDAMDN